MLHKLPRLLILLAALCVCASRADAQQVSTSLDASAITVTNDVAEATFKVVVKNEEETALSGVLLVFDDSYEVSVGDVDAETSIASEAVTRTFDLTKYDRSLAVAMPATLKYSAGGESVERAIVVVLQLTNQ